MADHTITWDHTECEHEDEDCSPEGTITCQAVGEGESLCRLMEVDPGGRYGYCESWSICDYSDSSHAMCPDFAHHDPGGQHCTEGHPIRIVGRCNALEWIYSGDSVSDAHVDGWPPKFTDGPIEVYWTGEGYDWDYVPVVESLPLFEAPA